MHFRQIAKKIAINRTSAIKLAIFLFNSGGFHGKNQKCYHQCF